MWVDHFFEYPTTKVTNIMRGLGIGRVAIYNYLRMFKESGYITYGKVGSEEVVVHQKLKSWLEDSFYVKPISSK
jgi:predicted transcriptional regulator